MFFDTHAHYDAEQFDSDRDSLLSSLPSQGVSLVLNPGCDLPSSQFAVDLADKYPYFYAAVGIHPSECGERFDSDTLDDVINQLKNIASHPKVKAIGEIGLDYYWESNPSKEAQHYFFHAQMNLSTDLDLPVIIHDRDAHEDCLEVVKEYPFSRGVYHCYAGSVEYAKILLDLGYMMSFTGVITYKNARKALEVLEYLPLDAIMIETDAPYLTPVPHRGKRNDSSKLCHTAQVIADLKGISLEECARITKENGLKFFNIQE